MKTKITKQSFGVLRSGEEVTAYTLVNGYGFVTVLDFGGIIHSIVVPDKDGTPTDIVLGYETPQEYLEKGGTIGAICGRFANRIDQGILTIDGMTYSLYCNDRGNHLHGGKVGFDKKLWDAEILTDAKGNEELSLSILSPDGEENYPGNIKVQVIYSWKDGALTLDYLGLSDKTTAINLTNHAYFNLNGAGTGSALQHTLWLDAPYYLPTDETMIPRGEIKSVKNTPFDFTYKKTVASGDEKLSEDKDLQNGKGFDHCFVFKKGRERGRPFAILTGDKTGIEMQCFTTQPSVQLYAGNFLDMVGKGGYYGRCDGLCLETQALPNNVNIPAYAEYGNSVYRAGEIYHYITVYAFGVAEAE